MFSAPRPCMRRFVQCDENKPVMLDEEETLNHTIPNIDLTFDADEPSTTGTLFITSRRFVWLSEETAYDFDVQYIALHAISNDPASYKKPCLYCQFDQEGDEDEDEPTEVFFIPADEKEVQTLFDLFSEAALNNPDDDEEEEEGGEEGGGMFPGGFIYNVDEVQSGAQAAKLNQWDSVFQFPGGEGGTTVEEPTTEMSTTDNVNNDTTSSSADVGTDMDTL